MSILVCVKSSGLSMQNPVYPGSHPVALPREDPLELRYRVVLHRGTGSELDLDHLQAEYGAEGA